MKKIIFIFICCMWMCKTITAQTTQKGIEARISIIEESRSKDYNPLIAVSVLFINNSDDDIYIPEIYNFSRGQSMGLINVYKKDSINYSLIDLVPHVVPGMGNPFPGPTILISDYNLASKADNDKQTEVVLDYIRANHLEINKELFTDFENQPLFLKSHQERSYFLNMDINYMSGKPGSYRIAFEPPIKNGLGAKFPDKFMGYNKMVDPAGITSNTVYLQFDNVIPKRREE